jgi:hypothetical protein
VSLREGEIRTQIYNGRPHEGTERKQPRREALGGQYFDLGLLASRLRKSISAEEATLCPASSSTLLQALSVAHRAALRLSPACVAFVQ